MCHGKFVDNIYYFRNWNSTVYELAYMAKGVIICITDIDFDTYYYHCLKN